jgi:DNA-binding cell septation regulator SpoVG
LLDIKRIFILPVSKEGSLLLALARIELQSGLFLSELRVYPNPNSKNGIFIAYPTRKSTNGQVMKVFYPNNDKLKQFIEDSVYEAYCEEVKGEPVGKGERNHQTVDN